MTGSKRVETVRPWIRSTKSSSKGAHRSFWSSIEVEHLEQLLILLAGPSQRDKAAKTQLTLLSPLITAPCFRLNTSHPLLTPLQCILSQQPQQNLNTHFSCLKFFDGSFFPSQTSPITRLGGVVRVLLTSSLTLPVHSPSPLPN